MNETTTRKTSTTVAGRALSALLSAPWYVWFAAILLAAHWLTPYDDTDNREDGERSGMALYTDYGTGCQYLKAGMFGGMTPRMDGKGTHVGCK